MPHDIIYLESSSYHLKPGSEIFLGIGGTEIFFSGSTILCKKRHFKNVFLIEDDVTEISFLANKSIPLHLMCIQKKKGIENLD